MTGFYILGALAVILSLLLYRRIGRFETRIHTRMDNLDHLGAHAASADARSGHTAESVHSLAQAIVQTSARLEATQAAAQHELSCLKLEAQGVQNRLVGLETQISRQDSVINRFLTLDFPPHGDATRRYTEANPHPEIRRILSDSNGRYRELLGRFQQFSTQLAAIPLDQTGDPSEAFHRNESFSGLDSIALYSLTGLLKPRRIVEIGSGHSTRFIRRSIRDNQLPATLTIIDPFIDDHVAQLADKVIKSSLETASLEITGELNSGDIVFMDGTHRSFMNSDVTAFFLDLMPRLKPGVYIHIHDIFWPCDYPSDWKGRFYNEQYLLGTLLLCGSRGYETVLPNYHVFLTPEIAGALDPVWKQGNGYPGVQRHGGSFWMRKL